MLTLRMPDNGTVARRLRTRTTIIIVLVVAFTGASTAAWIYRAQRDEARSQLIQSQATMADQATQALLNAAAHLCPKGSEVVAHSVSDDPLAGDAENSGYFDLLASHGIATWSTVAPHQVVVAWLGTADTTSGRFATSAQLAAGSMAIRPFDSLLTLCIMPPTFTDWNPYLTVN